MLRRVRLVLLLLLACVLALPAGVPAAAGEDAPCPSKPALEAIDSCVGPAPLALSRGVQPVQGCDLVAVEPAVPPPVAPSREATRLIFAHGSTARPGIPPSALDPPPRAA